jgi:hypothetical protein
MRQLNPPSAELPSLNETFTYLQSHIDKTASAPTPFKRGSDEDYRSTHINTLDVFIIDLSIRSLAGHNYNQAHIDTLLLTPTSFYTMPDDRHVHWPDEVPARTRPSQGNLNEEPPTERFTWSAYRRPLSRLAQELESAPRGARLINGINRRRQNRLTQENLERIPIGGPLANSDYRRPEDRLTQENLERVPVGGALANNAFRRPEDRTTSENANHGSSTSFRVGSHEGYAPRNRPAPRPTPRNPGRGWFMR